MKKERKRARTKKGQYVGDDPRTKDIDEAWEPVEDAAEQEDKEIFSGAYTKQKPPKYETEMETVRARNKKGRYLADDKSTPDVNEAYVKRKKKK